MGNGVNLVDRLYSELAGDGLARLASRLGEAQGRVQMAISVVVPALVAVLASKSATPQGRSDIFELIQTSGFDGRGLRAPSRLPTGASAMIDLATRGLPLVGALFGTRKGRRRRLAGRVGVHRYPIVLGVAGAGRASGVGCSGA